MCGIVGYYPLAPDDAAVAAFGRLLDESAARGQHAYGLAASGGTGDLRVSRGFARADVAAVFDYRLPTIAHTRYSTSGDWRTAGNNQPVVVGGLALAFNGVIHMGTKPEFEAAYGVQCESDNDGEVFVRSLMAGEAPSDFVRRPAVSFAGLWLADGVLRAIRNDRRPMWRCVAFGARWYASTKDIFSRAGFAACEPVPVGEVEVSAAECEQ